MSKPEKPSRALRCRTSSLLTYVPAFLLACFLMISCRPPEPQPPVIPTAGLDPAVARLIDAALGEVRVAPRSGDAWGKLGSVLMHYEFLDETRQAFKHAEVFSPRDPRWPHLHGLAISTRDTTAAADKFRLAATLQESVTGLARPSPRTTDSQNMAIPLTDPALEAVRVRLAQALAESGLDAKAEVEFQALLRLRRNHPVALLGLARLRHLQWSGSIKPGQRPTGSFPPPDTLLLEATNYLAGCLQDLHTAHGAHVLLATIQQALGNSAAAGATARASSALPADTPWPDPWWTQALAYRVGRKALLEDAAALLDQGRAMEAIVSLERATRDRQDDDEAWYLLGWALNQGQRSADAERALREHLRLSPHSPKGHAQLAIALLAQRRYAEAVEVLQGALKLKPTWRELHSNLGYACVQLGRDQEAITHFRNALALDPNYLPSYTALAELIGRRASPAEAKRLLEEAAQLDPTDTRIQAMLQRLDAGR